MELIIINKTYLEKEKEPVGQRTIHVTSSGVSFKLRRQGEFRNGSERNQKNLPVQSPTGR
jgi:hypothetical protein